ncbi:Crp/Fnr family transcriptional regulator [Anaerotignum lactatifermentans]|uniref:Crp/Fnr family transcriptional regulator n=1 Tax=Anaerotignum lactatifermentans TaxID=160404 RepID=A0ABS2G8B7_9FIRM|nr:Crp/Fnr family transcriptional regulator [Anaerotignum lactatifermentans]MBM6828819.1 Crp/Fnr family transcriptional regulator [Anaerotignum lactatifermentans]MBM6877008.1 Crp/Fnr family transcriptional regulator [Anaerotignum lactatifermentans]MBM6950566.1 Crp/Fnr family transcriptional regulator [Anaerotignum lactatifermentans]
MERMERIGTYPLFQNIKAEGLEEMLQCVHVRYRSFPKDSFLALAEEEIHYVGVICKGSVRMVREDDWGNQILLVHMGEGELFGETFVCSASFASKVSFVTAEETEILFLDYDRVMHTCSLTCRHHHRLIENMLRCIAEKNIQLMEKIEVISQRSLRDKLMTYLSLESQRQGRSVFSVPLSRVEMAEYLCADRSAVSRELASMQADGLISFEKNIFCILGKENGNRDRKRR